MVSVPGLKPGLLRYNVRFKAWALRNGARFKAWALRNGVCQNEHATVICNIELTLQFKRDHVYKN